MCTHPLLVVVNLIVRNGISLGDNGDEVNLGVELLHHLDIQRLQRMAGRLDKVNHSMDAVIDNVNAVDFVLSVQVSVKSLLDVLDDGVPRLVIVDKVTEAGCVNNRQPQTDTILLNVGADRLYRDSL